MAKFTWGDRLQVADSVPAKLRPGAVVWVVGVHEGETRRGTHFDQFPAGTVYAIEYVDGVMDDIHETQLQPIDDE